MIYKKPTDDPEKILIIFEIPGTIWAEHVNLVGDFNDWDRESLPFQRNQTGNWQVALTLEAGKTYRFRYLFDGTTWRDEWQADGFTPNDYGSYDGLVVAKLPPEDHL